MIIHSSVRSVAHADQLEAGVRDAACCTPGARCAACRAALDEIRAARRDAVLLRVRTTRPRRSSY